MERHADESAISAFFTEKVRSKLPFIEVIDHRFEYTKDICYITIGLFRQTINLDLFKQTIQKETGVENVVIHTREERPGFVIELNRGCRSLFLRRFGTSSKFKSYLVDFSFFMGIIFLIWIFFQ